MEGKLDADHFSDGQTGKIVGRDEVACLIERPTGIFVGIPKVSGIRFSKSRIKSL